MSRRESLTWLAVGLLLAPFGLLSNAEVVGYVACHRRVEQVSAVLVPSWDPATFHCGVRV